MGMFDYIRCNAPLPDDRASPGEMFQTKALCCCMLTYVITADGRFHYHKKEYESLDDREVRPGIFLPRFKLVHEEHVDMEYHGDIPFCGSGRDNKLVEYVARFTYGNLEWVRALETLSEVHRMWVGARE